MNSLFERPIGPRRRGDFFENNYCEIGVSIAMRGYFPNSVQEEGFFDEPKKMLLETLRRRDICSGYDLPKDAVKESFNLEAGGSSEYSIGTLGVDSRIVFCFGRERMKAMIAANLQSKYTNPVEKFVEKFFEIMREQRIVPDSLLEVRVRTEFEFRKPTPEDWDKYDKDVKEGLNKVLSETGYLKEKGEESAWRRKEGNGRVVLKANPEKVNCSYERGLAEGEDVNVVKEEISKVLRELFLYVWMGPVRPVESKNF